MIRYYLKLNNKPGNNFLTKILFIKLQAVILVFLHFIDAIITLTFLFVIIYSNLSACF